MALLLYILLSAFICTFRSTSSSPADISKPDWRIKRNVAHYDDGDRTISDHVEQQTKDYRNFGNAFRTSESARLKEQVVPGADEKGKLSLSDLLRNSLRRKRAVDDEDEEVSTQGASFQRRQYSKPGDRKSNDDPETLLQRPGPNIRSVKSQNLNEEALQSTSKDIVENSKPTVRPRKRLLIGYLAGTPFGGLGDNILTAVPSKSMFTSDPSAMDATNSALPDLPYFGGGQRSTGNRGGRPKRLAEPYPDPKPDAYAYPDPDADPYPEPYPDPVPLERLHVVGTNKTILLKDLAILFQANNIISTSKYLQGHQISGAVRYALDVVNADTRLLPDYELTFKFYDTRGLVKESVKAVMELWKEGAVAFIGPEDSCQTEAMMAAALNLPMISYKCAEYTADESKYSTFARTVPAEGEVSKSTVSLLKHFKWYKFTIIHQDDQVHKQLVEDIQIWVDKLPFMSIQNTTSYRASFNIDTKSSSEQVKQIVHETYRNTRIYVVLGDQGFLQLMLLEMSQLKLFSNGDYAVVYVDHTYGYIDQDDAALNRYYRPTIYQFSKGKSDVNSPLSRLMEISRSLFVVIPTPVSFNDSKYTEFWRKVVEYNAEEPFKVYRAIANTTLHKLNTQKPIANRYASYLYDAVILYAEALHETIEAKQNVTNGTAIIRRIWGKKYRSMQGFDVKIDEHGDAKGNFTLLTRQKVNNSQFNLTHSMVPTGVFVDSDEEHELPALSLRDGMVIDWIGGVPPAFEPECGFHNERCIKERSRTIEITCGLLAILVVVAGLVGFMVYRNRKIEKELAGLIWKIEPKEIQFISRDGHSADFGASRLTIGSQESDYGAGLFSAIDMHCLAKYKGALVAIKEIQYGRRLKEITRATKMEMKKMRALHHDNVNNFMGIIVKPELIYVVREYCAKGSLFDVLLNENIKLDELFTASFVDDLIKAMIYLHESELRVHGNLKSTNCVITSRWSLQVSDYGLHELREGQVFEDENQRYRALLWTAPELLLNGAIDKPQRGSQKADVFSFGIILHEIFTRTGPYGIESALRYLSPRDVYMLIMKTRQHNEKAVFIEKEEEELQMLGLVNMNKPYLPSLDELICQNYVKETLCQCWDERPEQRPDFRAIRHRLKSLFKGILRRNIMDHMMAMMEKHQNNLEQLVDERTMALNEEKKRVETLLHRMLPDSVAGQLMRGEDVVPESYDAVTIYFSDIVGFTSLSAESTPMEVVNFLNALYTLFDGIIRRYDVYKVETIGDAYMVVSGLPKRNGDRHAGEIATMGLHLLKAIEMFQIPHRQDKKLLLRIGIHTGPCVAGVVGKTMPRYCLFGDTVNTASRMESNGLALKIHCSEFTKNALDSLGGYIVEERGLVPMKGKGEMLTYWLLAKQEFVMASPVTDEAPLFNSGTASGKPTTANIHRRKGGAESLLHLPTRGESLTAIVARRGGAQPKLLQPPPAFSSTATKPGGVAVGGSGSGSGSTRNSRILTTVHAPESSSTVASGKSNDNNNFHRRALPTLSIFIQKPGHLLRTRASSVKRAIQAPPVLSKAASGDDASMDPFAGRLRRQLSVEADDLPDGLRKRSVSFPSNVQALLDEMSDPGAAPSREPLMCSNGKILTGSTSATNSASHTPRRRRSRNFLTPKSERGRPLSQPLLLDSSTTGGGSAFQTASENSSRKNTPRKEREQRRNSKHSEDPAEMTPFLTASQSVTSSWGSVKPTSQEHDGDEECIMDDDESESEDSPVPRKRSLSCGDAMIPNGPVNYGTIINGATVTAFSEPHYMKTHNAPLIVDAVNPFTSTHSTNSAASVSNFSAQSAPVAIDNRHPDVPDRDQNTHNDADDRPLLLSTARTGSGSDGCVSTPRKWNRKQNKTGSLQPLFTSAPRQRVQTNDNVGVVGNGNGNPLSRFLRYL